MKTIKNTVMTLAIALMAAFGANATTWKVGPATTSIGANFTSLSAAHTAAASGDTIQLLPGGNFSYGSATITKKLIIIGTGYFLNENNVSYTGFESQVGTITFNPGSQGSLVQSVVLTGGIYITTDNITVRRCKNTAGNFIIFDASSNSISNINIYQNIALGSGNDISISNSTKAISNIVISNNLFVGGGGSH